MFVSMPPGCLLSLSDGIGSGVRWHLCLEVGVSMKVPPGGCLLSLCDGSGFGVRWRLCLEVGVSVETRLILPRVAT